MRNTKKPLVVFVFPEERPDTSTRYAGFARRLQKADGFPDCETLTVALENLAFIILESGEADVIDVVSGQSLSTADFVYFKTWEKMPEEASALANYLFYRGVPFMDTVVLGVGVSKLATAFRLWGRGLAVPTTVYVRRADRLEQFLTDAWLQKLGSPFICKDMHGAKGKINFSITASELAATLAAYPEVHFICQRLVPNDGDYRIGVYAEEARFVIKRSGAADTHLNNTSAGGTATFIPIDEISVKLRTLAQAAARAANLQIAGVDIIEDQQTGLQYVLEVNQGSQIVTGANTAENMQAFNMGLAKVLRRHFTPSRKVPLQLIGRRTLAGLPALGLKEIIAKIDTGAYTSALHAENIRLEKNNKDIDELVFDTRSGDLTQTMSDGLITHHVTDYFLQTVTSSNGNAEERFSFKTTIKLPGQDAFQAVLTLSDRSKMKYPLLIGRRTLSSRYLVNVELDERNNTHRPAPKKDGVQ